MPLRGQANRQLYILQTPLQLLQQFKLLSMITGIKYISMVKKYAKNSTAICSRLAILYHNYANGPPRWPTFLNVM